MTAGYGDVQVPWGIDLEVREGEIACIVGSNGAGKTTPLATVSGLVRATGGPTDELADDPVIRRADMGI